MVKRKGKTTFAAVHLGSESITMLILEYQSLKNYKIIERCERHIHLGEETFKHKLIPFSLVNEICEVLQGYKELMFAYGVDEYVIKATTAVREARNQLFLLDQIKIKTGMKVDVVDMPQEIYTKYVSIRNNLAQKVPAAAQDGMLLMDISSGGLGITFVQDDKIKYQSNFHVGIIRIKEGFDHSQRTSSHFVRALTQFLSSTIGPVRRALADQSIRYLVLSGTESDMILKMMGHQVGEEELQQVPAEEFQTFFKKVRHLNLPQLIKVYGLPETDAELVLPTILLYEQLLNLAPAPEVLLPKDRFIDGVLLLQIGSKNAKFKQAVDQGILDLLHVLGEIYNYDAKHAAQVEWLSCIIFDKLGKEHGLDDHCRLLLRAAALLHDIGKYVSMRSHSLYSYQLIMGMDILGFDERDKKIIAMAAYYHAHNVFEDRGAKELPGPEPELLPVIAKISSIIRLADAMDRSYLQKIKSCKVFVRPGEAVIRAVSKEDLTLEEWTFASKAAMFEEVYGMKIHLERVNA